jgi:hypothetical protein
MEAAPEVEDCCGAVIFRAERLLLETLLMIREVCNNCRQKRGGTT